MPSKHKIRVRVPMNAHLLSTEVSGSSFAHLEKTLQKKLVGVSGFRSQYLVLAKHARFRLRQYPVFESVDRLRPDRTARREFAAPRGRYKRPA